MILRLRCLKESVSKLWNLVHAAFFTEERIKLDTGVNREAHLHIGDFVFHKGADFVMALYSFSVKPVSRLKGESAVKVAAYQSRGRLNDKREDALYDFTHKADLFHAEIFLPSTAPSIFLDRQTLWSEVDRVEKRYDARTGRAVIAALPNELTVEEQIKLVHEFVVEAFVNLGMCADVAIHSGRREDKAHKEDEPTKILPNNPHVHILLTDRPIDRDGFCAKKNRDWNKKAYVRQWRELWEKVQNREFERKGLDVRVRHESLEVQKIDREPTKHLGRKVAEMQRRGKETDRGDENRVIEARNKEREERKQQRQLIRKQDREFELSR